MIKSETERARAVDALRVRPAQAILAADRLGKAYDVGDEKRLWVLRDVTFSVDAGSSCAILGPSGSGKTTLLGLCAGLDRPTSGHVFLAGHALNSLDEEEMTRLRNRTVGFVFQTFQLLTTLSALENVMVPLELRGERDARDRARALLERVGLAQRLEHYPNQLSGGEQQRVAIARAFVHEPLLLFADEPTGNLDAETGRMVQDLLLELNTDLGTSLVIVTHDLELADRTQRVLRMRAGTLEADSAAGDTSDAVQPASLRSASGRADRDP